MARPQLSYTLIHERQREQCFKAFLRNNWLGATVFAGVVSATLTG